MNTDTTKKISWISRNEIIRGLLIYAAGDGVAALLLGEFTFIRLLGMMCIGATVYAIEIPNYFRWIDKTAGSQEEGLVNSVKRTGLAILYFNPVWIARHLLFIKIFSGFWSDIGMELLILGFWSFLGNIPLSLIANYLIQNRVKFSWRFFASAVFSALMAIYYALAEVIF